MIRRKFISVTMAFEAFITMLKVEDYDAGTEGHDPEHEDDVDDVDDDDEEEEEDDDDDDDEEEEDDVDEDDDNEEQVDEADDDNDNNYDDEVPTTPNAHSNTPMHIQPYYAPYPPPYYPLYPTDYMMTGPINPHTYTDASTMSDPATDTRRNRGGVTEPFPDKMHRMLNGTEREGLTDVVAFFSHGRAFAIHKPRRFVAEVMSRYFRQTRLTSFQRQLNLYGFRRISQGPDNGGYYHELFLKGRPGLCVNMKRTKVKGASKHKRDPETERKWLVLFHLPTFLDGHALLPGVITILKLSMLCSQFLRHATSFRSHTIDASVSPDNLRLSWLSRLSLLSTIHSRTDRGLRLCSLLLSTLGLWSGTWVPRDTLRHAWRGKSRR